MNNLLNFIQIIDEYLNYLKEKHFKIDEDGIPVFTSNMFLNDVPELIVPYSNRNSKLVTCKKKTVLCTFSPDKMVYPRINNLLSELTIYKEYMGVVTADITVTSDMDEEWQESIMLLNQLYGAILAVNNIKIILNTRIGNSSNLKLCKHIPKNIICISSFLGCKKSSEFDYIYIAKILYFLPSILLIYGKNDKNVNKMLDKMGINYKYYIDFHQLCKGVI